MTPSRHFPNPEIQQSQKQQKKTDSALLQQGNTNRKHFDRKTKRETTKNQQLLEVTFYVTTDLTEIEETK